MLFGNREPRSLVARRRGAYKPTAQMLEDRLLLAASVVDLGGSSPPTNPAIATVPYGVDLAGGTSVGGAGFSVTDVGDLTGSGFDDFVVGAPTVINQGGQISLGTGNNATVYLILGSQSTTASAIVDWLTLTPGDQRVGDLNQLGNSASGQQNPISGNAGFPFAGIKFITSQEPGSQLGASVSPAGIINGSPAFLIGAPGGLDVNGQNAGTGRAYLVYGGANLTALASTATTVDLDNVLGSSGVNFVTFVNPSVGARTGRAVAGVGPVITDGTNSIAIGAPNETANGLAGAGATFLIPGSALPTNGTFNLAAVGQTGGVPTGVVFSGAAAGDQSGFSLAGAGNVNGALTSINTPIGDLLIGAPQTNTGAGAAYLVYGSPTLSSESTTVGGVTQIPLASVGTTAVPGARIAGTATGDLTGFSVSTAGDSNGDGVSDFLIGSPGYRSAAGRVDLLYGTAGGNNSISGNLTLGALPTNVINGTFVGGTAGDQAGFAVSQVGKINTTLAGNPFLIGAPGFSSGNGTAYLFPPNVDLEGVHSLSNVVNDPTVAATQFTLTNPSLSTPSYFGASLGGRQTVSGQAFTADGDQIADFIIGAPGYTAVSGRGLDGGAFIVQGGLIQNKIGTPTSNVITSPISVDATPPGPGVFTVSATTPNTVTIYVDSNATTSPTFDPVTQLDPTTIVVNGVAFPNATITAAGTDFNNDGIEDAIITISPRSALNLLSTTTTFTLTARTLPGSINPNKRYIGTTAITVTGGGGGGGGGGSVGSALPKGTIVPTQFIPPFGPETLVPSLQAFSANSSYKPIPLRVAVHQYLPGQGFSARLQQFVHPVKHIVPQNGNRAIGSNGTYGGSGYNALSYKVFDRSKYHGTKVLKFTHKTTVIPTNLQSEVLSTLPSKNAALRKANLLKRHK